MSFLTDPAIIYGQVSIFGIFLLSSLLRKHLGDRVALGCSFATFGPNSTWMVMSHLSPEQDHAKFIGNLYGLRTWIEYGFKQCKNELGWADYRLTHYEQIERWWEMVSSVYLMVSLQFYGFGAQPPGILDEGQRNLLTRLQQHPDWQEAKGWKRRFNNVQLLVQPFIFFCLLQPWMELFNISTLERGFTKLIRRINSFSGWSPLASSVPVQYFSSS